MPVPQRHRRPAGVRRQRCSHDAGIDGTSFGAYRQSPTQINVYAYSFWKVTQLRYFIEKKSGSSPRNGASAGTNFSPACTPAAASKMSTSSPEVVVRRDRPGLSLGVPDRVDPVRPLHVVVAARPAKWGWVAIVGGTLSPFLFFTHAPVSRVPALPRRRSAHRPRLHAPLDRSRSR